MQDDRLVRVLRALADPRRFRMVRKIAAAGELNCSQVGRMFDLSQPTISHHLKLLADAGVLTVRQDGQNHFISVDRKVMKEVVGALPMRLSAPARAPSTRRR